MNSKFWLIFILFLMSCGYYAEQKSINYENKEGNNKPLLARETLLEKSNQNLVKDTGTSVNQTNNQIIWQGEYNSTKITWTNSDLIFELQKGNVEFFSTLAERDFKEDKKENQSAGIKEIDWYYKREFRLLSVVGDLVSYEDKRTSYGTFKVDENPTPLSGPGSASIEFTTIHINKKLKKITLSDYFDEKEILQGLMEDNDIKQAFLEREDGKLPKTLSEIEAILKKNSILFKNYRYTIYSNFLNNFAFEDIVDNKVKVKLIFPNSQSRDFDYAEVSLLLSIPAELKENLFSAHRNELGFLMKDAAKVSNGRATTIKFERLKD